MIHKYGYKISLLVAVLSCALGCAIFLPAKYFNSYPLVLFAIFIISTGLTIINVAANPFATLLGDPEGAHQRINFVQVFSRVGYAATPLLATALIYDKMGGVRFDLPYLFLALCLLIIAIIMFFSPLPSMKMSDDEKFTVKGILKEARSFRHLFYGVFAMFFYLGAEACTAAFFIPYLKSVLGFSDHKAAGFLTLYYIFTAFMGMMAVFILKYIRASKLVALYGLGMILLYIICIAFNTGYNEYFLAGLGLFLSIMFPTIFSLAIEDIGAFTGKGSALLNFALVGGSIFPPLQGLIADAHGVKISYIVPLICFVMITIYAMFFTKRTATIAEVKK
jgi:FHS family L-fucose permease-like MFS transporter